MSRILYYSSLSPPCRAVLLTTKSLGLDVQVKVIDTLKGEQHTPEYLKINPLHQIPVYTEGDLVLTESRAISCYLASSVKSKLYPTDLKRRAVVDARLYFDATNLFPAVKDFVRPVLRGGARKVSQERREAIQVVLTTLESFLKTSEWFSGTEMTIADLAILANVAAIKMWGVSFVEEFPMLNGWYDRCRQLPGFLENQEGAQALADKLKKNLDEPLWKI